MKYKAGDRVKIKTWEQLEKEYPERGVNSLGSFIQTGREFYFSFNYLFNKTDREVTISRTYLSTKGVCEYGLDEHSILIHECWIESLVETPKPLKRWQILDLRE